MIVHGGWLHEHFFLWGEQRPQSAFHQIVNFQYPFLVEPFELKLHLFRHDRYSFYGTFIDTSEAVIDVPLKKRQFSSFAGDMTVYQAQEKMTHYSFPLEGIIIPIDSLLAYLPTLHRWKEEKDVTIAPDLEKWLDFFSYIQVAISAGAFAPSPSGCWELSDVPYEQWLESFPSSALSIRAKSAFIQKKDEPIDILKNAATLCTDAFIRDLLHDRSVLPHYANWERSVDSRWLPHIKQLKKKGRVETSVTTPTFRESIGVVQQKPFLSGLALKEPATSDGTWSLSLCMIDRNQRSLVVEMNELERGEHPWRENPIAQLKSDLLNAKKAVPLLESLRLSAPIMSLDADEAFSLFTEKDELLKKSGFQLIVPKWMLEKKKMRIMLNMEEPLYASSASEPLLDWQSVASFTYSVAIGDKTMSEVEFAQFVEGKRPFLFADGSWIVWDRSLAEQLRASLDGMKGTASYLDAWRLDQHDEEVTWDVSWSGTLTSSINELYSTSPTLIPLPQALVGKLRPYQHEGASWLAHLRRSGFGGCLADDMGLGKSLQTITYILYVLEQQHREKKRPFLLICPTSLLFNWVEECKKFAPSLRVFVHHGRSRMNILEDALADVDLILTTYQSAVRDTEQLQQIRWNGLILDEAQQIKNVDTKQRRVIRAIDATHRIALSGTPIENRLRELWSLLDVLNPSYLGTYEDFQTQFIKPIEKEKNSSQLEKLQMLIRPFILRRKKSDEQLRLGLPKKQEITHRVHLSIEQAALYQAVVDEITGKIDAVSSFERRALILKSLTKLKQICNHPAHFLKASSLNEHESGKWLALLKLTDEIVATGEKVLIFSQYKEMGALMAQALTERYECHIPFLHGSLTRAKRQEMIEAFQHGQEIPIFILSLKAGGVGLNLTAATNVIHYDRWWNPAVENQATDRVYRIGQTNDVTVHKLITTGTLEERIDQMLSTKQELADQVLAAGEQPITELTKEELLQLIALTSN